MPKDLRRLRPVFSRWMSLRHWRSQVVFWIGGLLVGVVAVLVAKAADGAQALFHLGVAKVGWLPLVITPAGFALSAFAARRWFPGSQGSGIPQVIAATEIVRHNPKGLDRLVSLRVVLGKTALLFLGLLTGASIGREGPTVQIGAALMRMTGRIGGIVSNESALLLAGGAAGVAAAFNTPLAGIVFAIEELGKSFEQKTSGTVIFTVMLAGIASLGMVGDYVYFGHSDATLQPLPDTLAVLVCGLGGGALGGLFARILVFCNKGLGRVMNGFFERRRILFAALCGLSVALIGLVSGTDIFGTGYSEAHALLVGTGTASPLFGVLKWLSTLLSSASGIPGGLFAPSLATGAGLGADMHWLIPVAPLGTMVLLGMVAYFSGVVQSPLTSFVIVMEMTNSHNMVIPLIAASVLAYSVSRLICPRPLYHSLSQTFINQERRTRRSEAVAART
ncbi:chloride channel protein [Asticcacaulis sp. 201]|uniref:chloride channel protein n=1 Tax=Asticcacaulis sp. 201 TaxID=3028787 RepID=UPI002916DE57|nr:chloride channel protein [Asticcacaulis sp. 201]MDV6329916.1 chloride channel protein [Asticcacaulis sp. 201]